MRGPAFVAVAAGVPFGLGLLSVVAGAELADPFILKVMLDQNRDMEGSGIGWRENRMRRRMLYDHG